MRVLDDDRALITTLLSKSGAAAALTKSHTDLPALQALLRAALCPGARELAGLGTAFGDVLAKEIGLNWVLVTDQYGSDHALQFGDVHVLVFPRSMFLKRIGRGEKPGEIDLGFMLSEVRGAVHEQVVGAARIEP
jgi:hypothetical protein